MKTTKQWKRFLILLVMSGSSLTALANKPRLEERLSRLFFWQMSQALDLTTSEEKEMTRILSDLHRRRLAAIDRRNGLHERIHKLLQAQSPNETKSLSQEASKLLKEYRSQIDAIPQIDIEEHEKLKKIFGEIKLLKFYDERKAIIERIKSALN